MSEISWSAACRRPRAQKNTPNSYSLTLDTSLMKAKSLKRKCATTHQRRVPLAAAGKHLAGSFGSAASALGRRLDGAVAGCANGACDALEGRVRGCGGGRWPGGRRGRGGGGSSGGGRDAASGTGCGAVDSGGSFPGRLELIVVSPSSVTSAPPRTCSHWTRACCSRRQLALVQSLRRWRRARPCSCCDGSS